MLLNPQETSKNLFFIPGHAAVPPEPMVLALGFTNQLWSLKLKSAVAKTNTFGSVELDPEFKIIKAIRSDK